ncbi:MAG: zinc metalloprotease HtpX [Thermodesulfobacteriota bacterium]
MGNQIRTTLLLGLLTGVIVWIGHFFGGTAGMVIALLFAGGMNFFSYWYSDKIVLKMYRAKEISPDQNPGIYRLVENLARQAGLPMPKVYVIAQPAPNAFATGRNPENAVVAVTEGLLKNLNQQEIAGVIAHELGHVKNRDILIGSIAATMAGAVMMLASLARWSAIFGGFAGDDEDGGGILGLIVMSIVAPLAAMMIQMAISRSREYLADTTSAQLTGNPENLARALEKLEAYGKKTPMQAEAATAHMFITNPLAGRNLTNLFSTHPPIEKRIARLRGTENTAGAGGQKPTGDARGNAEQFWNQLRG